MKIRPICFFDLETSGTDLTNDKIVQFAALKVTCMDERLTFFYPGNQRTEELKMYINPGFPMKPEVIAIHGITDEMVKDCPPFKVVAPRINEFISGCDLSGYNIKRFDIPFLAEEMGNAGIPFTLVGRNVIDPFILYKILNSQSLSAAYKKYTGTDLEGAHDAMNDVVASLKVLQGMIKENHIPEDVAGILKFQANGEEFDSTVDFAGKFIRNKEGIILLNFGKHKGCPAADHLDFIEWMVNKDFTNDTIGWCYQLLSKSEKENNELF